MERRSSVTTKQQRTTATTTTTTTTTTIGLVGMYCQIPTRQTTTNGCQYDENAARPIVTNEEARGDMTQRA